MDREKLVQRKNALDSLSQKDEHGVEYWFARDIMQQLGYSEWRNFSRVIEKARLACLNSGQQTQSHFRTTTRQATIGSGAVRGIEDVKLTRYACYLVAQNGDPRKEEVALLQSYFALQTRTAEMLEQRMAEILRIAGRDALTAEEKHLSQLCYEHGAKRGFAIIRSAGDEALFGKPTKAMKRKLEVPDNRPLADRLHPMNVTAKQLATQMTNYTIDERSLCGVEQISHEHSQNNSSIRQAMLDRGIRPEELPAQEDIEKVRRRNNKDAKRIEGDCFHTVPDEDKP
ncbi:DNA damage-inducible protein D [Bifidobacterium animalis]|uniref:DNA damage-inducible protein D n=1 Tax=Bifidobacterium animalis TaxID=28025 RepID=UPI0010204B56|nr:DNA damage-inducible protein D [Bifidobacterium animalis]RYN04947.1 damage-inducible protein D [Bifidobacterium animalis subsp. lactis]